MKNLVLLLFIAFLRLASEWSSTAWRLDVTVHATLGEHVVHLTVPRQTAAGALRLAAAGSHSAVILVRLPPAVSVSAAADELVLGTLAALVGGGADEVGGTAVLVDASVPIVEWSSTERVKSWLKVVVGTWALGGSVGVGSVIHTSGICVEVDWNGDPLTVGRAWQEWVLAGWHPLLLDVVVQVVRALLVGPTDRPDSMLGLVEVVLVLGQSHREASVALADRSSAVVLNGVLVVVWPPAVVANNTSLGVVVLVCRVPEESVAVSSDVRVTAAKVVLGAGVTVPELLAGLVEHVHWWTSSGNETVSALGQAPASVEAVSRDSLVLLLQEANQLLQIGESLHGGQGLFGEVRDVAASSELFSLDGVLETVHVGDYLLHHEIVVDALEELVERVLFGDDLHALFKEVVDVEVALEWSGDFVVEVLHHLSEVGGIAGT